MSEQVNSSGPDRSQQLRDFLFKRELAEVYLLLDYISGRSDTSLSNLIPANEKNLDNPDDWLRKLCLISWPSSASQPELADQARNLLLARDKLNGAAFPASGASIAFTVLVTGDRTDTSNVDSAQTCVSRMRSWLCGLIFGSTGDGASSGAGSKDESGAGAKVPDRGDRPATPNGSDVGAAPNRISLASQAYPGLVGPARRFRIGMGLIFILLFIWVLMTSFLSWDVAGGHAIISRIQTNEETQASVLKQISEITLSQSEIEKKNTNINALIQYCSAGSSFGPVIQRQLCELKRVDRTRHADLQILSNWLRPWKTILPMDVDGSPSGHSFASWLYKPDATTLMNFDALSDRFEFEEQNALVLLEVLGGAILPICYGFLGAGTCVARSIWAKMRESLLNPRDVTLALGQLVLGAVIGACIGLFVTPTSTSSASPGSLLGTATLSVSALSFIAGFGVEAVFVALESLIRRVFNTSPPSAQTKAS